MNNLNIQLSERQMLFFQLLNDPQIVDILMGGGAGGSKTISVCLWMLMEIRNNPGIRIGLGRKELTRLKQTTLYTLIHEAHPMLGVKDGEFRYQEMKGLVSYANGGEIQLVDLAYQPSDPDYDRFGSLNFTHTVIEEAGEIRAKAKNVFTSRKNRYLNGKLGIVGKSVMTCNPSQNFLKNEYYKPYEKLGAGPYQKWEFGRVEINGKMKTAYRAFVKSLVTDNPFIPQNYIEVLRKLPDAERKRLFEGNWNYSDSDLMLFKSSLIDRSMTDRIEPGERWIGVDISDTGKDKTILTMIEEDVIVEQKAISVESNEAIGEQIAKAIIKYAQQNGIDITRANHIAIDSIGVGASTRDFLRSLGWRVKEFVAGGKSSDPMYKNLRGEVIYSLSQEMDKGNIKIYENIQMLDLLREDLMAHEYTTEERRILVKGKAEIKEVLGRSPDNAESAYIAFWCKNGNNDPRDNVSRIVY